MNKRLVTLMVAALALLSASGQVNFTNVGQYHVIEVTPERTTGLDRIYVVYNTDGVGMEFNSTTGEPANWERFYYQDGSLVMESIPGIRWNGMATVLDKIIPNTGYKIDDGGNPFYCWVVNYADYYMSLNDMFIINDSPCSLLTFRVDGTAPKIPYTTLNGRIRILDREIKLTYNSLEWDDSTYWQEKTVVEPFESLDDGIQVDQPLCNTIFKLTGDRFLEEWGIGEGIESEFFQTQAVDCGTTAVQENRGTTMVLWILALLRIALCLFPQNGWLQNSSDMTWGIIRNIPFTVLGAIVCFLYFRKKDERRRFRLIWLYILLSFLFYIPVAVGAGIVPMLGMLMLPKTVCYILMVLSFLLAVIKDKPAE